MLLVNFKNHFCFNFTLKGFWAMYPSFSVDTLRKFIYYYL